MESAEDEAAYRPRYPLDPTDLPHARRSVPRPGTRSGDQEGDDAVGRAYLTEDTLLLSHSAAMRAVKEIIEEVAGTSATVLIRGESGVGKDLVARAIHAASPRRDRPFVRVNCAALPAELLESELFGHERGAFTGAYRRSLGKFEFAHEGTIFLDEIGELSRPLQAKLLHVLQDFRFSRIGGRELIQVDVRVLGSTNRDLEAALRTGEFREDLYYRLNVLEICVPPLRQRREEIPALVASFLDKFNRQYGRDVHLSPGAIALFAEYPWPGNIRQLENTVRRLVILGRSRQVCEELLAALGPAAPKPGEAQSSALPSTARTAGWGREGLSLREIARRGALEAERKVLAEVLARVRWNRTETARILKVSYKTLLHKIQACGLAPGQNPPKSAGPPAPPEVNRPA